MTHGISKKRKGKNKEEYTVHVERRGLQCLNTENAQFRQRLLSLARLISFFNLRTIASDKRESDPKLQGM